MIRHNKQINHLLVKLDDNPIHSIVRSTYEDKVRVTNTTDVTMKKGDKQVAFKTLTSFPCLHFGVVTRHFTNDMIGH